ncbi:MAG: hypothetical protein ACXWRE_00660 [Pseudobdellovibrionaceae bacterium]
MCTVDKLVDKYEGKNVYCVSPQFLETLVAAQGVFIHEENLIILVI